MKDQFQQMAIGQNNLPYQPGKIYQKAQCIPDIGPTGARKDQSMGHERHNQAGHSSKPKQERFKNSGKYYP
jgi:hypothetical protein